MPVLTEIAGVFWWLQPEYYQELVGMSPALGIDAKNLLVAQYAYEFSAFCTSVIAHDSTGKIIHSRNLDFAFAGPMRNITYEGIFMRNDQELYRAVMFAGLNGVLTGHRQGFSISLNERKPSFRSNPWDLLLNIANIFFGFPQVTHVIRDTLQECSNYACAFNRLATTSQIAPSYYAVSGTGNYEGAIISRDRYGVAHIDMLSDENWYVAQTNDDHWTGVCTIRCQYVRDTMNSIGAANINGAKIVDMLKQWPSNNEHSIYNVLMINSENTFDAQLIANDKPAPI
jgi:N-acylethanolamine-hydrolysing acid amidase